MECMRLDWMRGRRPLLVFLLTAVTCAFQNCSDHLGQGPKDGASLAAPGETFDGIVKSGGYLSIDPVAGARSALSSAWTPKYADIVEYLKMDGPPGPLPANSVLAADVGSTATVQPATNTLRYTDSQVDQGIY